MRRKREAVLSFESCDDGLPRVVRDYRARYRKKRGIPLTGVTTTCSVSEYAGVSRDADGV
jgi:hypothetical protein